MLGLMGGIFIGRYGLLRDSAIEVFAQQASTHCKGVEGDIGYVRQKLCELNQLLEEAIHKYASREINEDELRELIVQMKELEWEALQGFPRVFGADFPSVHLALSDLNTYLKIAHDETLEESTEKARILLLLENAKREREGLERHLAWETNAEEPSQNTINPSVIEYTMAKDVFFTPPFDPIGKTSAFSNADQRAFSWLKLGQVCQVVQVQWKFYDPTGQLYFTHFEPILDPGSLGKECWEYYTIWCSIDLGNESVRMPGDWWVEVYLNDQLALTQPFTVE